MPSSRSRPALWPTLAAIVGIALTLALGNWQVNRGNEKAALAERVKSANRDALIEMPAQEIKAEDIAWHRVQAHGTFEPKYTLYIDNRVLHGVAGYHVMTPLRLGASDRYVLVNRGWVAATSSRTKLPAVATPGSEVTITGLAVIPSRRFLELSTQIAEGNVWQNFTLERFRAAVPIAVQPVVIEQDNDSGDGLKREWGEPDLGIERHYGYAFQWFALAAAILAIYVVHHVRKRARQPD